MKQIDLDHYYLKVAKLTAELSQAKKRKVGAVLVKDDSIISFGFNGTPSGFDNCCETKTCSNFDGCVRSECDGCPNTALKTKPEVLHAESNAITKCAKYGRSTIGSTLYITCEPCIECAKLIIQSGISRVVYIDNYHSHDGLMLLNQVPTIKLVQMGEVIGSPSKSEHDSRKDNLKSKKPAFNEYRRVLQSLDPELTALYNAKQFAIKTTNKNYNRVEDSDQKPKAIMIGINLLDLLESLHCIYNTSKPLDIIRGISIDPDMKQLEVLLYVPISDELRTKYPNVTWTHVSLP